VSHLKDIQVSDNSPRRVGVVESDMRDKTRKVRIEYLVKHPKYGKYVRRKRVLQAHDETNQSHTGDRVEIAACRRISKTKSWIVTRVVESGAGKISHATEVAV
jgi:small subunit ribosomal protein S17